MRGIVGCWARACGCAGIAVAVAGAAPFNDNFDSPGELGQTEARAFEVDSLSATRQVDEPAHAGATNNGTLWWKWTAPADGLWSIELPGLSARLVAYLGEEMAGLTEVASSTDGSLELQVTAGQSYRLVLASELRGPMELSFSRPPANDAFANRIERVLAPELTLSGSTRAATREAGEPEHAGDTPQGGSIWWELVAAEDGLVSLDLLPSEEPDWNVAIYRGDSLEALEELARRTRWSHEPDELNQVRVKSGERLVVAAAWDDAEGYGNVGLHFAFEAMPQHDAIEDAVDLGSVTQAVLAGDLTAATADLGTDSATVWWRWTAPSSGVLDVRNSSSTWTPEPAIYRQLADGSYQLLGASGSRATSYVFADEELWIQAGGSAWYGAFEFDLTFEPAAPNDDFDQPAPLVPGEVGFDFIHAGPDRWEDVGSFHDPTLWWIWTAPADGLARFFTPHGTSAALYVGETIDALEEVPSATPGVRYGVSAGSTYRLRLADWLSHADESGSFDFHFDAFVAENDNFADAADLGTAWRASAAADGTGSTLEPGEPPDHVSSVWWKWTAPADAVVYPTSWLAISGNLREDTVGTVYAGTSVDALGERLIPKLSYKPWFSAVAGQTYHIAVPAGGPVNFELEAFPSPTPNDDFADVIDLGEVLEHEERLSFVGATTEAGEPDHDPTGFRYVDRTRWWSWTAPEDVNVELELDESSDTLIGVYEGPTLGALELVDRVVNSSRGSFLRFAAEAGRSYRIVLAGGEEATEFRLRTFEPPPGDRFDDAVDLGGSLRPVLTSDLAGATLERGEPAPDWEYSVASIWWRWQAPGAGLFEFEGSASHGTWRLFEGSALENLVELDPGSWRMNGGEELWILLQGGEGSSPSASLRFYLRPENDDFDTAADLGSPSSAEMEWEVPGATVEAGEPDPFGTLAEGERPGTAWWKWTAPDYGVLRLSGTASPWLNGGFLALYAETGTGELRLLEASEQATLFAELPVLPGRSYWLQHGFGGGGSVEAIAGLALDFREGPVNDTWEGALALGPSGHAVGDLMGATVEDFEAQSFGASGWWKWTAPGDGTAYATTEVVGSGESIALYRDDGAGGIVAASGEPFPQGDSTQGVRWSAEAGATYYLAVHAANSTSPRAVELQVAVASRPGNDDFASAVELADGVGAVAAGTTLGAGVEAGESSGDTVASVWYRWAALADGPVRLSVASGLGTLARVFTGGSLETLVPVTEAAGEVGWLAQAGTSYWIAVSEIEGAGGEFELSIEPLASPANDDFAARLVLLGKALVFTTHNFEASAEPGEPAHVGAAAESSIWYEWTAPAEGRLEITLSAAQRLALYTGDEFAALATVATGVQELETVVEKGARYLLAIDTGVSGPGLFEVAVEAVAFPPNDDFADRTVIAGYGVPMRGSLDLAGVEPGEPQPPSQTLWWEWTAPSSDRIEWTSASGPVPWLNVYTAGREVSLSSLRLEAMRPSSFRPRSGTTYYFQVGSSSPGAGGEVDLVLVNSSNPGPVAPSGGGPPNDHFADRLDMGEALPARAGADPLGATTEADESYDSRRGRSLWWSWTAPWTGVFQIRSTSPDGSAVRVYRGETLGGLDFVDSASGSWSLFSAVGGESYAIAVYAEGYDSEDLAGRRVGFEIEAGPEPAGNDLFAAAIDLGSADEVSAEGTNVGATAEPDEPPHGGVAAAQSVWWRWTAPRAGSFEVSALGPLMRVGVYRGEALAELTEVASGQDPLVFEAAAGEEYLVALDASVDLLFTLRIREVVAEPPPVDAPNDAFADAIALGAGEWSGTVSNLGSSFESGEPLHFGDASQSGSVWWKWTAPADGPVSIGVSGISAYVSVYHGETLGALLPIVSASGNVRFRALAGVDYRIAVSGTYESAFGTFDLEISQSQPGPVNDDFAAAQVLPEGGATVSGTTEGASLEAFEPRHEASGPSCPASVWYRWTSPSTGLARLAVSGVGGDCAAVYRLRDGGIEALLRTDSAGAFQATGGESYWMAVAGSSSTGAFELSLEIAGFPENDDFADRIVLPAGSGARGVGSTLDSTLEAGEPDHGASNTQGSVWWSWTAEADEPVTLDFRDSPTLERVAVHTGDSLGSLVQVASDWRKTLEFSATAGTSYQIAVTWAYAYAAGDIDFTVRGGRPANDEFDGRIVLGSELPVGATTENLGATARLGDPGFGGARRERTLWWSWVAAEDGWVDLDFRESFSGLEMGVFTGPGPGLLGAVETVEVGNRVRRFRATAGREYVLLAGVASESQVGEITFDLQVASELSPNDRIASAIRLIGDAVSATADTLGAALEAGDPVAEEPGDWERTLWWSWQAPRSGVVSLNSGPGAVFIYRVGPAGLEKVEALPGGQSGHLVDAGAEYRIAAATGEAGPVAWSLEPGVEGDLAAHPVALGLAEWLRIPGSLAGASWEVLEPFHAGAPAERSVWFRWTAPYAGRFRASAEGFRVAVYAGEPPGGLSPRGEGSGEAYFHAVAGASYRVVVDEAGAAEDFELTLHAVPTGYEAWRSAAFGAEPTAASMPAADPDGDGWANAIERMFSGDPQSAEPDLVEFRVAPDGEMVAVELVRPSTLPEGGELIVELSRDLLLWDDLAELEHSETWDDLGGGWGRYRARLTEFETISEPGVFGRLKVRFPEE